MSAFPKFITHRNCFPKFTFMFLSVVSPQALPNSYKKKRFDVPFIIISYFGTYGAFVAFRIYIGCHIANYHLFIYFSSLMNYIGLYIVISFNRCCNFNMHKDDISTKILIYHAVFVISVSYVTLSQNCYDEGFIISYCVSRLTWVTLVAYLTFFKGPFNQQHVTNIRILIRVFLNGW